ncbi:hypothetical protein JCM10914A_42500 [Paenibacillus sp. JCM 10914]|uniref:hypothetical protein n=1 Tax=Paenibacillus sp. JCM 10914 TaxID=1236974 RepID=UPI0003CCA9F9|nr:hypothetical protein [Paenibacillus sp. JCM 10914]GAE05467.1 hypothetical protein JCM10914_1570 [Paenibacillus sp. JCM 10914]
MNQPTFTVMSDLYNRIFVRQISNPDILVDYAVWNRILESLPKEYKLPDEAVTNI